MSFFCYCLIGYSSVYMSEWFKGHYHTQYKDLFAEYTQHFPSANGWQLTLNLTVNVQVFLSTFHILYWLHYFFIYLYIWFNIFNIWFNYIFDSIPILCCRGLQGVYKYHYSCSSSFVQSLQSKLDFWNENCRQDQSFSTLV